MGTVIYSASPLQAFLSTFGVIALILLIALFGIWSAFFDRKQRRNSRIGLRIAGGFLLIVSCGFSILTLITILNGHKTVNVLLNNKMIAHDNLSNGKSGTRFVLETGAGPDLYDFNIPQSAYDKAEVNTCYQITYYPKNVIFSEPAVGAGSYQQVDAVTQIEMIDPANCH
jgi:apolipoprotein N-acyltransferase